MTNFLIVFGINVYILIRVGLGTYVEFHRLKYHGSVAFGLWLYWAWGILCLWADLAHDDNPLGMLYKWIIN